MAKKIWQGNTPIASIHTPIEENLFEISKSMKPGYEKKLLDFLFSRDKKKGLTLTVNPFCNFGVPYRI